MNRVVRVLMCGKSESLSVPALVYRIYRFQSKGASELIEMRLVKSLKDKKRGKNRA